MTSFCSDWNLERILEAMTRCGYEGLEPRVGWPNAGGFNTDLPHGQRAEVRERLEKKGPRLCVILKSAVQGSLNH